jgi:transcription antitermination factor NusA-like protein
MTGPHGRRTTRSRSCQRVSGAGYPQLIQTQALPNFDLATPERYAYGARSEAAIFVGDLLSQEVPALANSSGSLEIVAIARRPGVLSKVAVRSRVGSVASSIGADHLAHVTEQLDGERIQIVRWQPSAAAYIADALGLGEVPPVLLLPTIAHARVLLGEIDVRGMAGWRGLNTALASALTGWRIRLEPVAATVAWERLERGMRARRPVTATVVGATERGPRLEVSGLYAVLSGASRTYEVGERLDVRLIRMDPDEGRIFASDKGVHSAQPSLI